jgi:hypothetical protein
MGSGGRFGCVGRGRRIVKTEKLGILPLDRVDVVEACKQVGAVPLDRAERLRRDPELGSGVVQREPSLQAPPSECLSERGQLSRRRARSLRHILAQPTQNGQPRVAPSSRVAGQPMAASGLAHIKVDGPNRIGAARNRMEEPLSAVFCPFPPKSLVSSHFGLF